ncbi:hypothetical protein SCLCIDRAFT_22732 [Scleroderma citrinum Foug A]|uniref:Uncharacterized protein n=1 Tax=Scleroderma citrinum Foug A TaxID=1036808 RepID=A0A0C3ECC7_9AGAM|nr:hypothetical protein SCLCIDRAFT_22732 [Scleroderma citrinum Foug A]
MAKPGRFIKSSVHFLSTTAADTSTIKTKRRSWKMRSKTTAMVAHPPAREMTSSCAADMRLEVGWPQGNPTLPHTTIFVDLFFDQRTVNVDEYGDGNDASPSFTLIPSSTNEQ